MTQKQIEFAVRRPVDLQIKKCYSKCVIAGKGKKEKISFGEIDDNVNRIFSIRIIDEYLW